MHYKKSVTSESGIKQSIEMAENVNDDEDCDNETIESLNTNIAEMTNNTERDYFEFLSSYQETFF